MGIHLMTRLLYTFLREHGIKVSPEIFFDTITVKTDAAEQYINVALENRINLRQIDAETIGISLDETVQLQDVKDILSIFLPNTEIDEDFMKSVLGRIVKEQPDAYFDKFTRTSPLLTQPVFNKYRSETEMLRYINYLQGKDLSLADAMIPLGSCTMKLNATTEMLPITWPEFTSIHPFAPPNQAEGYHQLIGVCIYQCLPLIF